MRSIVVWVCVCAIFLTSFKVSASEDRVVWLQKHSKDAHELRIESAALSDYYAPGSSGPMVIEVDATCLPGEQSCRTLWRISGNFVSWDQFRKILWAAARQSGNLSPRQITLNSQGGNMQSAMNLGSFVRANNIDVKVEDGDICLSACVYVLSASARREIGKWSLIGVHQQRTSVDLAQEKGQRSPREFLRRDVLRRVDDDVFLVQQTNGIWIDTVLRSGISPALLSYAFKTQNSTNSNQMHVISHACSAVLGLDNQTVPSARSDVIEDIRRICGA